MARPCSAVDHCRHALIHDSACPLSPRVEEACPLPRASSPGGESGLPTYTPSIRRTNAAMRLDACLAQLLRRRLLADADCNNEEQEHEEDGQGPHDNDEDREHQLSAPSATTWGMEMCGAAVHGGSCGWTLPPPRIACKGERFVLHRRDMGTVRPPWPLSCSLTTRIRRCPQRSWECAEARSGGIGGSLCWARSPPGSGEPAVLAGCAAVPGRGYYLKGPAPDALGRLCNGEPSTVSFASPDTATATRQPD